MAEHHGFYCTNRQRYLLTAAIGAGSEKIAQTEPAQYGQYMDLVNLMTYTTADGRAGPTSTLRYTVIRLTQLPVC